MDPGRFHIVISLCDTLSIGGMFHVPSQYDKMLLTQIQLHLHGQRICNSDYPGAQSHLFQLVGSYKGIMKSHGLLNKGKFKSYVFDINSLTHNLFREICQRKN
jgi:hypothetical protein